MSVTSSGNVSNDARLFAEQLLRGMTTRLATARWPIALVGLAVLSVATWWVTNSAIFDLRSLHIRGNVHLTKGQVAKVGDLTAQVNVLWTMPGTIERRLERHPWIREAHVSRTLPSALTVVIKERRPVAVLPDEGAVVAPDGKVLGKNERGGGLPMISAAVPAGGDETVLSQTGLAVARTIPAKVRRLIQDITISETGRVQLRLRDGTVVVYGDPSDMRLKSAVLQAILRWTTSTGTTPKTIDVSVPGAPTLVPAITAEPAA